ncbi:centrosome-associated protein Alms1a-like [Uranotaenia lowii]|uniref:centrosome-associated protein Alms1a-like n=1 Tax=Uranotaenia lowii TaxID=190385 RepID=UPI00247AACAA|nr:centrosome-associated protein Alms1a-like [Uranotaenia lowii]
MASCSGTGRVTDQIMDYYLRYGQNRDLEKFLRLRASTTRSSSDGSLPAFDELDRRCKVAEKLGRSMENLNKLQQEEQNQERSKSQQDLLNASTGSGKSVKSNKSEPKNEAPPPKAETVVVKESKVEKKSGRSFNFNLESVIEIKLPPAPVVKHPEFILPHSKALLAPAPVIHEINSTATQTLPEARSVEQQTEEDPIRPVLKPSKNPSGAAVPSGRVPAPAPSNTTFLNVDETTIDTTRDISPVSSVASNRQRLEWDSLGDIGYDSNEKFYFCGAADLNETEKRCLQKYFAKKGINLDEKIVVVKNLPKSAKTASNLSKEDQRKGEIKQRWQDVYKKYIEKYRNTSDISSMMMNPDAQSTPKITTVKEMSKKSVKSTQTSLVKNLSKSMQVEKITTSEKLIGTESLASSSNSSNDQNPVSRIEPTPSNLEIDETEGEATSFQFFTAAPIEKRNSKAQKSSAVSTIKTTQPETSTSFQVSSTNSTSAHESSTNSSSSSSKKHQQLSSASHRPYDFDEELRLGMTLYGTICESQSLPAKVKQSLIDKIFRKMMRNDPRGRSQDQLLADGKLLKGMDRLGEHPISGSSRKSSQGSLRQESNRNSTVSSGKIIEEVIVNKDEVIGSKDDNSTEKEDAHSQIVEEPSVASDKATNQRSHKSGSSELPSSGTSSLVHPRPRPKPHQEQGETSKLMSDDQRVSRAMSEFLKPITHSELNYANQQELLRSLERRRQAEKRIVGRETVSAPTTQCSVVSSAKGDKIFELFRKEKQSQMMKIDKKIEHLKSLKELLLDDQRVVDEIEGDMRTTYPVEVKLRKVGYEEKENIYENTIEDMKQKSRNSAPVYTSIQPETPSEKTKESSGSSAWNSHYHMKKMIQNRSKLETPTSDVSVATFIKNRQEKFIEVYQRQRKQMFEDPGHLYTRPYSGRQSKHDHYIRPDPKYNIQNIRKTNLPRSEVFISSDSMSIPAANTFSNTTTHQYDIKTSRSSSQSSLNAKPVGTQTTGSIFRTKPIFETAKPKLKAVSTAVQVPSAVGCQCACDCPCRERSSIPAAQSHASRKTEIVHSTQTYNKRDKQQQAKPSSIAYVITFQGDSNSKSKKPTISTHEKDRVYRAESTDISLSTGNSIKESHREQHDSDSDLLPLKEQLRRNRPQTVNRMKQRQQCINELNKLRSERNKQRKKLLLLTSDDSLKRNDTNRKLPPPPLAQRRIFSSKDIRENTRRQVRNLPEVLRKKELEKANNLKRKNLILRDKFNKNLQRKVLHGHVDLSNSVRIMQD